MRRRFFVSFMLTAAITAFEVAVFVSSGSVIPLGSAVFCGSLTIFYLIKAVGA